MQRLFDVMAGGGFPPAIFVARDAQHAARLYLQDHPQAPRMFSVLAVGAPGAKRETVVVPQDVGG